MFHHFLCQLQTETYACKLIEFWPSDWISVTRLNFYGYIVIKIEFLDPENLLLDIFHYVLCQLQTEISKFIEFWRPFLILAVILFLLSGQLGLLSKMHSSDLNPQRITYKLCMIMFKCLRGSAPAYLADYCTSTSSVPGRSALRSAAHGDIVVPIIGLTGVWDLLRWLALAVGMLCLLIWGLPLLV